MCKKYLSVFLFFVFLFPLVEKELHAFSHKDDFHCTATSQKHFHEQQHDCSICDFTPAVTHTTVPSGQTPVPTSTQVDYLVFSETPSAKVVQPSFYLRGPPRQS